CKRRTVGLRETRYREWLLELEFRKRETFAYCCEAYSRILALANRAADRPRLVEELAEEGMPDDDRIDAAEYVDILRKAAAARNGWKRILARCAPARRRGGREVTHGPHEGGPDSPRGRGRATGRRRPGPTAG